MAAAYLFRRLGDDAFELEWPDAGLTVEVSGVHDERHDTYGIVRVSHTSGHIHLTRLNLWSTQTRASLAKFLTERTSGGELRQVSWGSVLEVVCVRVLEAWQEGAPFIDLAGVQQQERPPDLLTGFLPQKQISIVFTKGGSGKSLLAQACCAALVSGVDLVNGVCPAVGGPVLYLDWEADEEEVQQRTLALLRGMGASGIPAGQFIYRPMTRALADEAGRIGMEIARLGVTFVVVDSLSAACGRSAVDDDTAQQAMNAIRSWRGVSSLVVAHVNKADATSTSAAAKSVFGSVQFENRARSIWELRKSEDVPDDDGMAVGLYHRKTNRGRLRKPFGLRFQFEGDADWPERIAIRRWDIESDPSLSGALSLGTRILRLLRSHGQMSTTSLAEELDEEEPKVRSAVNRLAKGRYVVAVEQGGGRGKSSTWGLVDRDLRVVGRD